MKILKCCGRICVVLDMLVLIPIFGTSTTHIRTHEVFEDVHAYLCSFKCASVKTNIWHMVTLKNPNPNPYTHSQLMHMTFLLLLRTNLCIIRIGGSKTKIWH